MERILTPQDIISCNFKRTDGKQAWQDNLHCAIWATDKTRSTLGPKGSYKLVAYNRGPEQVTKVTKDAIAVLDELAIQYPPATIVSEAAKLQREEAGDGSTGFVILLSAMLRGADDLFRMKVHANTVVHGYHLATDMAIKIMEAQAAKADPNNDILDTVDCNRNLLTPKIRGMIREAFPYTFTDGRFNRENIRFLKKTGGSLNDSSLIRGIIIKKQKAHHNMPDRLKNPRIAFTSEKLGINRLEVKMRGEGPAHIQLNVKSPQQMRAYWEAEYKLKAEPIQKLMDYNVNVLLCQQPMEDQLKCDLQSRGIFAVETVDQKDLEATARSTGAKIVGNLNQLTEEDIGSAGELTTGRNEFESTITINGCEGATFMLRGNTSQTIDELETAIKNALLVLKLLRDDGRVVAGGGAMEAHLTQELKRYAKEFKGREQIVIESYAKALMEIPWCLAQNYGLNPTDTLLDLSKRHAEGACNLGVGYSGCCEMVCEEPLKIKRAMLRRAYEVSALMLRIDELVMSTEIAKFHKK